MTDEQMNIAICKAIGWTHINIDEPNSGHCPGQGMPGLCRLPDHINGIEALGHMHEAEKLLHGTDLWNVYGRILFELMIPTRLNGISYAIAQVSHAPARQRAIAFLRTLNLYK